MSNAAYIFHSPKGVSETMGIIEKVVLSMNGKVKRVSDNQIEAKWKIQSYHTLKWITIFPVKCMFYVGEDMVRAVMAKTQNVSCIASEIPCISHLRPWNAFLESLTKLYPDLDFGVVPGTKSKLVAIKIVSDGIEQVFTSTSYHSPSIGGAVLGGMLLGDTGAIIGSLNGRTITSGKSSARFSNELLAEARYDNGLVCEGILYKNSQTYNEIMVNMSKLNG